MPLVRQFSTPGIGHVGHLVVDTTSRRAIAIDPSRDVRPYLDSLRELDVELAYVLDTHAHNDYLSGVLALADLTGAEPIAPIGLSPGYDAHVGWHRRRFDLGPDVHVRLVHAPGHTPEHTAVVVTGGDDLPILFAGGSLLLGDVGRPDLLGSPRQRRFAAAASRHAVLEAFAALPDGTVLLPTHVGGSLCAGSLEPGTRGTLGEQRADNGTLRAMGRADGHDGGWFDASLAPPVPSFWPGTRAANVRGVPAGAFGVAPAQAEVAELERGALMLDVRDAELAPATHPRAVRVPPGASRPVWLGVLADEHDRVVFIADDERAAIEANDDLLLVHPRGASGWVDPATLAPSALGEPASDWIVDPAAAVLADRTLVDVRNPAEVADSSIPGALPISAPDLLADPGIAPSGPLALVCASSYRATIVASALRVEGVDAIALTGVPVDGTAAVAVAGAWT